VFVGEGGQYFIQPNNRVLWLDRRKLDNKETRQTRLEDILTRVFVRINWVQMGECIGPRAILLFF